MTLTILQPDGWPRPRGYSNGMAGAGRILALGGQIGWDAAGVFADGLVPQVRQALQNILAVLAVDGAGPEHIVRMTWYVVGLDDYRAGLAEIGAVWKDVMGRVYPAMAVVGVSALVEPEARIEIEATAMVPD